MPKFRILISESLGRLVYLSNQISRKIIKAVVSNPDIAVNTHLIDENNLLLIMKSPGWINEQNCSDLVLKPIMLTMGVRTVQSKKYMFVIETRLLKIIIGRSN